MEEAVKRNLHAIYSSSDQKEATNFFSELISSETECSSLLKILIEIFLQEENENLKKMSLIIIREMNYVFIMESVFILFQNSSSKYYSVIEILTEKLASQKSDELIPMIDNILSTSTDLFTFTTILQLLNSIKSVSFKKQTEITNFESKQKEYYEHFIQIMKSIIENQKPSAIEYYFMFYFANFFFDLMNELNETEFYHDFSFYFLQQQEENENHEDEEIKFKLIDVIVKYYPLFYSKNQLIDIIELLLKHCQRTKYIPNEMILIWPYLIKNEENSVNYNLIVANFIFPQFKFHPNLMIDDKEKFLDEFDPYPDSKSELPNEIFKGLIFDEIPYEKNLYSTVYQFVEEYYEHFVDKDSSEICRIFNFFSIFARPDNEYTQNFFGNKVIPLINTITNMKDPDLFLIIGICQLIKNISHFIDDENNEFFGEMCPTFVNFLKWSVFNEFDANEQILKLIFYFVINSISSLSKAFSIDMFDFNDEEATIIFTKISQLYTEINNESLNVTFNFLIEKMIPDETDIESFVCMIWNLIIQHKDKDLLDNFFILITNFFDVCFDEKETIFNVFFQLVTDEESKDFLIEKCYINVLELFVLFTKELLDKPEKVQFFIESIGKCIFEMICSINSELMPDFLIKNSKKSADEFQRLINEYKYFCYHIINYINDPNLCLEMFLKPFILPIIEKIEEINESCNFNDFSFTALVAPLIKFKGNEDIFCFMFEFYETFIQLKTFGDKTKNYFLASLIISNPSILFDCFDKNQYQKIISETIPQLPDDILLFEIKEVLSYLANEKQEIDLINAFAQLFSDELNKLGYNKDKTDDQIHFDTSTLYTFSMYNENLNKVISTIFDILAKFEAKFSNGE